MMKKFEVTFYYIDGNIEAETINSTLQTLLPCEANTKYKVRTHEINKSVYNSLNAECDELREVLWEQLKQNEKFASLVNRMRVAQEELDVFENEHEFFDYKGAMKRKELISKVIKLESEVDEYLKKMEI